MNTALRSRLLLFAALNLWTTAALAAGPSRISPGALAQIHGLEEEKAERSLAQQKMDSNLIYARKKGLAGAASVAAPHLQPDVKFQSEGRVLVDITASVSEDLLSFIRQKGGQIGGAFAQYDQIRALVPLGAVEAIAERADVRFVSRAHEGHSNLSSADPEGDICHEANLARAAFGADGTGIKVGVLSNGDDSNALAVAFGYLPAGITTLSGQSGAPSDGEGTAMLEVIYRLAPGAQLYYGTGLPPTVSPTNLAPAEAQMASNIIAMANAGCKVIVDDISYPDESPFQESQPIVRAVQTVSDQGILYFSCARNSGNQDSAHSSTWEGDFVDGGPTSTPISGTESGRIHNFGGGTNYDLLTAAASSGDLFWADPLGGATNDYDLFVLDASGSNVVAASTTTQNGTQDPYEHVSNLSSNLQIVIVKHSGANRFLHLDTGRGQILISTAGCVRGHNSSSASNAFCVAATPAYTANGNGNPVGPYPYPFSGGTSNLVEFFSSDGPRRLFFNPDGSPITPGNFSSTGGALLAKPDFTAADGVSTSVLLDGMHNVFFGTSCAAPHAAAIAALLLSYNPSLTPSQLRMALTNTALALTGPDSARTAGAGIIMAYQALASVSANFWTNAASGKWETASNWSLHLAPDRYHAVIISNAASKTVTIDPTTSGTFPATLTNFNLTLSAPSGATNTLFLNNEGPTRPLAIVAGGGASPPSGNLILDGQGALVLNHSVVQAGGSLDVGNTAGNCALTITNGGTLSSVGVGYLGVNSASANNSALVSGSGSVLACAGELHVGDSGSGNTLTIANGGAANSGSFCLLGAAASSGNNSVSVTGAGSTLTCTNELHIGGNGPGNTMTISAGGTVLSSSFGVLGFGSTSSNNTVVVADPGSSLTTLNELHIGNSGPANTLIISNGAAVYCPSPGVVGFSSSSSGNSVSVTGAGSLWTNASNLFIGYIGASNNLTLSANGSVFAKSVYIGTATTNAGNRLSITNASLVVTNGLGNAPLNLRNGVLTFNGGTLAADLLLATNGANSVVQFVGGNLSAGGCAVSNNQTFTVGNGSNMASFNLIGGAYPNFYSNIYSFANGLEIRSNAVLTGCGTIYGSVTIDPGGTVQADCGDTLNFFSAVTNNGNVIALNGTFINFYGPLVNNTTLNGSNGNVQVFSTVLNSGALQTNNMAAKPLLTTLYSFTGGSDGANPNAGLVQASDGNLYGTTTQGGTNNYGTVFRISPAGVFTNVHRFGGTEGAYPFLATLAQGSDGFLYGTAYSGGAAGLGTVFKMSTAGGLVWYYNFGGTDGAYPKAGVIQASDGNFYGTTYEGGSSYNPGFGDYGNGVVFRISAAGSYTNLHSLNYLFDGNEPEAALVQGSDGLFYGSAYIGGIGNVSGTAFKVTSGGALTELLTAAGNPIGAFVQGSDGLFYGTGSAVVVGGAGSVFRFNSTGAGGSTTLHNFTNFVGEGSQPSAGLVQGSDGNFYGTTIKGGIANTGTVFRITTSGALTTLRSFTGGSDGSAPAAPLVQGLDGNFYGTTSSGGTNGAGTVFKLSVYLVPPVSQLAQITRIQPTSTNVAVTINSVAGKGYQLQYRDSLGTGSWTNVSGASTTGIGGPLTLNDPGGAVPAQRFYRVVITP